MNSEKPVVTVRPRPKDVERAEQEGDLFPYAVTEDGDKVVDSRTKSREHQRLNAAAGTGRVRRPSAGSVAKSVLGWGGDAMIHATQTPPAMRQARRRKANKAARASRKINR